jgi:phosphoesterase RecJ-like protein
MFTQVNSKELLHKHKSLTIDLGEHILNFGRIAQGAQVVVLFKENLAVPQDVRVNLRSHGGFDVNSLAQSFGGGGHKTASGVTIRGQLTKVTQIVLDEIKKRLKT